MLVLQLASPIGLLQIGASSHPLAPSRPMRQGDHLVDDPSDSRLVEFVIGHLMVCAAPSRWTMRVSRHGFAAAWTQGDASETFLATADELIE
jgi:hypothetical protein